MPKYNFNNIPAEVFFGIMKTKDYQQLKPKNGEKGLEECYIAIYDEFFIKSDNEEAKRYLELSKEIAGYKYKIAILKQSLHFYYYNKTTREMRMDFIKSVKEGYGIEIDTDAPFREEVKRLLTIEIGIIENELSIAKMSYDEMTKKSVSKDFDYYDKIVGLGTVLPNNPLIKEKMLLVTYIALEKAAEKEIKRQEAIAQKRKK